MTWHPRQVFRSICPYLYLDKDLSVKKIKAAIDTAPIVEEVLANTASQPQDNLGNNKEEASVNTRNSDGDQVFSPSNSLWTK